MTSPSPQGVWNRAETLERCPDPYPVLLLLSHTNHQAHYGSNCCPHLRTQPP